MPTIRIESVLGGHAPISHFGSQGQYRTSLGIDPALPISDTATATATVGSGLIRPAASEKFSGTVIGSAPLWITTHNKDNNVYVYDANGSAYSINVGLDTVTALSDGGTLTGGNGKGMAYYDNYIYFAKATDIARYGPLDGAPVFTGTYWTGTLALTALTNQDFPSSFLNSIRYPNHPMHYHSDGRLYIGDKDGNNKGQINYIATKRTAAEGDTNDGSTYAKLVFSYGQYVSALESYGTDLAIAIYDGTSSAIRQGRAKIAFWDTNATAVNKINWAEFPDSYISAMKNINGSLYVVSGNVGGRGFRVSRFVGGYSYEQVWYSEVGEPCFPGAIDGTLSRLLIGSHTNVPESDGCVWSLGLQNSKQANGFFNVMRATGGDSSTSVTSLLITSSAAGMGFQTPIVGWTKGTGTANNGIDKQGTAYNNSPSVWWSPMYRVGQPFKITKIRIPLAQAIAANQTIIPTIYVDEGGTSTALTTINNTNYPNSEVNVVLRPNSLTGKHNFWLELRHSGSALAVMGLPITIEYELLAD